MTSATMPGNPTSSRQYMSGGAVDGLELPLPAERTLEIAKGVCRGLAHAHTHNVIHRDLKPGNVWLAGRRHGQDRRLRVGGCARAVAPDDAGHARWHRRLHATGAGARQRDHAAGRPLLPWLHALRDGHRPASVRERQPDGSHQPAHQYPPVAPSWHTESCPQAWKRSCSGSWKRTRTTGSRARAMCSPRSRASTPAQKAASHSESNVLDRLALGVFVGREQELDAAAQSVR